MAGLGSFVSGLASGVDTGMRLGLLRKYAEREEKELTLLEENRNMVMDNTTLGNLFKVVDKSINPEALQSYFDGISFKNPTSKIIGQAYLSADVSQKKATQGFLQDISNVLSNSDAPNALDKAMTALNKFGAMVGTDNNAYKAAKAHIEYIEKKGIKEDEKDASAVANIFLSNMGRGKRPSEYGSGEVEMGWEPSQYGRVGIGVSNEDLNTLAETNARNEPAYMEGVKRAIAMTKASREAETAGAPFTEGIGFHTIDDRGNVTVFDKQGKIIRRTTGGKTKTEPRERVPNTADIKQIGDMVAALNETDKPSLNDIELARVAAGKIGFELRKSTGKSAAYGLPFVDKPLWGGTKTTRWELVPKGQKPVTKGPIAKRYKAVNPKTGVRIFSDDGQNWVDASGRKFK